MLLSSTGQSFASAHAEAGFAAQLSKRRDGHPDRNARVNDVESQAWLPNVLARINDYQRGGRAFPLPNRPGTAARQPAPARASLRCRRQAVSAAGRRQAFALVVKWATARSNNNGLPILIVEVSGGTQLALQFDPKLAAACAESLARAAALTPVKGTA